MTAVRVRFNGSVAFVAIPSDLTTPDMLAQALRRRFPEAGYTVELVELSGKLTEKS
jgi:disulfide oxidoreductase YuzD